MVNFLRFPLLLLLVGVTTFSTVAPPPPPPGPIAPYLNGIFPKTAPGANNSWALEDRSEELSIASPLNLIPFPGSEDILVLSKLGTLWRVNLEEQSQELVLDIRDRAFKLGEAGTTSVVLHPHFGDPTYPDKQLLFVLYRSKPEPDAWTEIGFNRLSKFQWDASTGTFDTDTEEILIQQYDKSTWHNGGGLFFRPEDGFLYVALGDEGMEDHIPASTQRLDGGLFGGILRIDVDNDPSRSHPIRRQPQNTSTAPPDGWGATFTQGYMIPNDNPWLDSSGSILEEFYAIGLRSPFSTTLDPVSNKIWVADVGSDKREEINVIEKAGNYQWPYVEGELDSELHARPENLIGEDTPPLFSYGRNIGGCIIGGFVYEGTKYPSLVGKYLFADYRSDRLMALTFDDPTSDPTTQVLVSDLLAQPVDFPVSSSISGVFPQANGDVLLTVLSTEDDFVNPGKILRLAAREYVPDPPAQLSELGVFSDLETLTPVEGIIPYQTNAQLWSDRAVKKRWMAIPNDGTFDSEAERIRFHRTQDWVFPEGTVFIKHFDLPLTGDPEGPVKRLETRFFIMGEDQKGYGLTYQWNDDDTDATLLIGGDTKSFEVDDETVAGIQTWDYPSREQCITCHTANAKYVLGVKTHQLNGELYYPLLGSTYNQLEYLNMLGVFQQQIGAPLEYPRAYAIDDESASLELRIRSYLDANCASCHRQGGVDASDMDLRFGIPLGLQNLINQPTMSSNSDPDRLLVKPGNHAASELWVRDASESENLMPPLARRLAHQEYVDKLAEWIDNLPEDAGIIREMVLYPNPTAGWVGLRLSDDWQGPFEVKVYNAAGQLLRQAVFESPTYTLDMTGAAPGTYALEVTTGRETEVRQFVVY